MTELGPGPHIEVRDLSHAFHGRPALRGVNLELEAGRVTVLIGPNGSGKTTLLRLLAGTLPLQQGTVRVAGYDLASQPQAVRRQVGFVAEDSLTYPGLTALENLEFFARLYGASPARPAALLRRLGLWSLRDQPTAFLSRGQRQRLAIGRALLHEPVVFLLDEPYSGLDVQAAAELDRLLGELAASGRTVLVATHDAERARRLGEWALLLNRGHLVGAGPCCQLLAAASDGAIGCSAGREAQEGGTAGEVTSFEASEQRRQPAAIRSSGAQRAGSRSGRLGLTEGPPPAWPAPSPIPGAGVVIPAVVRKDLILEWRTRELVAPASVFALLVAFLFHYALPSGQAADAGPLLGALWVALWFGSMLGLHRIAAGDGGEAGWLPLAMTPVDRAHLFFAKSLVSYLFGLLIAAVLLPAAALLLGLPFWLLARLWFLVVTTLVGWSAAATLLAALTTNSRARQVLLPVVLFPVVLPLTIAALQASFALASGAFGELAAAVLVIVAYGILFLVLGALTFPLVVESTL